MFLDAWSRASLGWQTGAIAAATVALWSTRTPEVPLASGLAVTVLVAAALVDLSCRRLPDRIVVTAALAFVALSLAPGLGQPGPDPATIAIGALAMSAPLAVMHIVSATSMGLGDVKTAAVLGAAAGAVDWQLALSALALAAGATATVGVLTRARTIAFGPGLVAATAVALAAHSLLLPAVAP